MNETLEKQHTVRRYEGELQHLHRRVLDMGALALEQVERAIEAMLTRDVDLAREVAARDSEVDALEKAIDAEIVAVLALRGPVGSDLRMVMAASKSLADLERIGDEAVKIAERSAQLFAGDSPDPNVHLIREASVMGRAAIGNLQTALEAFERMDLDRAREVIAQNGDLEEQSFPAAVRCLMTYVLEDPRNVGFMVNLVLILRSLARIGAHAQNIAEYVVFKVSGEDIRHGEN